jgi:uncharacterized protein (DUF4415 family)
MRNTEEFDFSRARRFTEAERERIRQAIERKLGRPVPRVGRPSKGELKYRPVSIRLHPLAWTWAKKEAKRRGIGYQTVINEALLKLAA